MKTKRLSSSLCLVLAVMLIQSISFVSFAANENCRQKKESGNVPSIETLNSAYALMPVTNGENQEEEKEFQDFISNLQGHYRYYVNCEPQKLKGKTGRKLRLNQKLAERIFDIRKRLSQCQHQEMQGILNPLLESAAQVAQACVDPLTDSMERVGASSLEELAERMKAVERKVQPGDASGNRGLYFEAYENSVNDLLESLFSHIATHSGLKSPIDREEFREKAKSTLREKFCVESARGTNICGPEDAKYETYHTKLFQDALDRFIENDLADHEPVSVEDATKQINDMVGWKRRDFQNFLAGDPANRPYEISNGSLNDSIDEVLKAIQEFDCENSEDSKPCDIKEDKNVKAAYEGYLQKLGDGLNSPTGKLFTTQAIAKRSNDIRSLEDFWQKDYGQGLSSVAARARSAMGEKSWSHSPDARKAYHRPVTTFRVAYGIKEYTDRLANTFKVIQKDRSLAKTRYSPGNNTIAYDPEQELTFNNRDERTGDLAKLLFLNPNAVGKALMKSPEEADLLCPVLEQKEAEDTADFYAELGLDVAGLAFGGASLAVSTTRGLRLVSWAGRKLGKDWAIKRAGRQAIFRAAALEGVVGAAYMGSESATGFSRAEAIRGFWSSGEIDADSEALRRARESEDEAVGDAQMAGLFAGLSLFGTAADYADSLRSFDKMARGFVKHLPEAQRGDEIENMKGALGVLFEKLDEFKDPEKLAEFFNKAGIDLSDLNANRRYQLLSGEDEHVLSALQAALGDREKVGELLATLTAAMKRSSSNKAAAAKAADAEKNPEELVNTLLAQVLVKSDDEARRLADEIIDAGNKCKKQAS